MSIKEMRNYTGLSQSKFAHIFDIPVATLKDWEQGRRTPPTYVINMMRSILQFKGLLFSEEYLQGCEERRRSVERVLAILYTATSGPNPLFMDALDSYIEGNITLEEMEARVDRLEYLGV